MVAFSPSPAAALAAAALAADALAAAALAAALADAGGGGGGGGSGGSGGGSGGGSSVVDGVNVLRKVRPPALSSKSLTDNWWANLVLAMPEPTVLSAAVAIGLHHGVTPTHARPGTHTHPHQAQRRLDATRNLRRLNASGGQPSALVGGRGPTTLRSSGSRCVRSSPTEGRVNVRPTLPPRLRETTTKEKKGPSFRVRVALAGHTFSHRCLLLLLLLLVVSPVSCRFV